MTSTTDYTSKYKRLVLERPHPRILRVVMSNEGRLNAADETMHDELGQIWLDIDKDESISAVILAGAGKNFSAGGDFSMIKKVMDDWPSRVRIWKEARALVYNVINCNKPIVSAMQGASVGAGLVCGLLADISIAAKDARIIDGHTRLGVAAGDHSAIIWPLLCGMAKAKYYLLLCEAVSGEEAERIGLVSLAVDKEELEAKALEVATRLANGAPAAVRWTKYALNNWFRLAGPTFDTSLGLEWLGFTGPEVVEGLASFSEKRPPNFSPDCPL